MIKVLRTPIYTISFASFLVAAFLFLALFALPSMDFLSSWRSQSRIETERAEECDLSGQKWDDDLRTCDMYNVYSIFTARVIKNGRSITSEHVTYNYFKEIIKITGEPNRLRGCIYLLKDAIGGSNFVVESVYDDDTLYACTKFLYPGNNNLLRILSANTK